MELASATTDFSRAEVLRECLEWIKDVSREGGRIVKEGFLNPTVAVDYKEGYYDVVTEYDRRTEEYLMAAISSKYPGHK